MPNGSRPGPKPDPYRARVRALFSEYSDRTFARYWRAHTRLMVLKEYGAIDQAGFRDAIARATRPNGTINVTKLADISETLAAIWVVELEDGGE